MYHSLTCGETIYSMHGESYVLCAVCACVSTPLPPDDKTQFYVPTVKHVGTSRRVLPFMPIRIIYISNRLMGDGTMRRGGQWLKTPKLNRWWHIAHTVIRTTSWEIEINSARGMGRDAVQCEWVSEQRETMKMGNCNRKYIRIELTCQNRWANGLSSKTPIEVNESAFVGEWQLQRRESPSQSEWPNNRVGTHLNINNFLKRVNSSGTTRLRFVTLVSNVCPMHLKWIFSWRWPNPNFKQTRQFKIDAFSVVVVVRFHKFAPKCNSFRRWKTFDFNNRFGPSPPPSLQMPNSIFFSILLMVGNWSRLCCTDTATCWVRSDPIGRW